MNFLGDSFQKFTFTKDQLTHLIESAKHDLSIARTSELSEIRFKFSYDALIKIGLFCIAKEGYRVRSTAGHHVQILERLGELENNEDVAIIGNVMRQKRNRDLYEGICSITDKEAEEYLNFIENLIVSL